MKAFASKVVQGRFAFLVALGGMSIFVAAVVLWKPVTTVPMAVNSVDEARRGVFFAVAKNSARIVAVGEHGRILYSADRGQTWTSAQSPTTVSLTGLYLLNDQLGWAVGYEGVILKTRDGAVTWQIVRTPATKNPPLFAVWFQDENVGLAVGADSSVYRTIDGGTRWDAVDSVIAAHLYAIIATHDQAIWIAGENNALLHSTDIGISWQPITPPFKTSFFGAIPVADHHLMTFGLRGRIAVWNASGLIESQQDCDETLSTALRLADGRIVLAGQRGRVLIEEGRSFRHTQISPAHDIGSMVEVADAFIFAGEFGLVRILKSDMGL